MLSFSDSDCKSNEFWSQQKTFTSSIFSDFDEINLERRHIEIAKEKSLRDANLWLLNYEALRRDDLVLTMSDSELKDWSEAKAMKCGRIIAGALNDDEALAECKQLALVYGMEVFTEKKDYKYGVKPVFERFKCMQWWLRQVRKLAAREIEKIALATQSVHKKGQVYCSDYAVKKRLEQKQRNRKLLESFEAINDDGQSYTLAELSDKSVSNPENMRGELMVRLRGFEEFAGIGSLDALFFTVTCPSKYHPSSKKFNGSTPRESQQYLCEVWARIRAQLDRESIDIFGFRVAEPHKDGCPHWHLLLFVDPGHQERINEIFTEYALAEDGNESGAKKRRVTLEVIDTKKGSAVGYISKYICKNIDGKYTDKEGDDVAFSAIDIDGNYCGKSDQAALRVDAWSSVWGIRQFQQIGGPSVTVWRELRRLKDVLVDDENGDIEAVRKAASEDSDWCAYCVLMCGMDLSRSEHLIKALRLEHVNEMVDLETGEIIERDSLNRYGEPMAEKIIGVVAAGFEVVTRFFSWDIRRKRMFVFSEPIGGLDLCQ